MATRARHVQSTNPLPYVDQDDTLVRQEAIEDALARVDRAARRMAAAALAYGMSVHDSRTDRFDRSQKAETHRRLTKAYEKVMRDAQHTGIAMACGEPTP